MISDAGMGTHPHSVPASSQHIIRTIKADFLSSFYQFDFALCTMAPPSSAGSHDNLLAVVASASLFVTTAILSQWIRSNSRIRSAVCDDCREFLFPGSSPAVSLEGDDRGRGGTSEEISQWYATRRLEDRLSFHNLQEMTDPRPSVEDDAFEGEFSDNRAVESAADFYPRNTNWTHFERDSFDVDTCSGNGAAVNGGTVPGVHRSLEGDDDDDEDAGFSTAGSEEDHFVWTQEARQYAHRPKRNITSSESVRDPALVNSTTPTALSRAVSLDDRIICNPEERQRNHITPPRSLMHPAGTQEPHCDVLPRSQMRRTLSNPALASSPSLVGMNMNGPNGQRHRLDAQDRTLSNHVRHQNRAARASYNARIMPNTLTLIRHGQSIGNVDEKLYSTTPDNAMPLTKLGWEQAQQAGRCLKERILRQGADGDGVHFIVSPYVRTVETFHGIVSAWCDPSEFNHIADRDLRLKAWYSRLLELGLTWHEDPRIREQGTYAILLFHDRILFACHLTFLFIFSINLAADFGNFQESQNIIRAKNERHRFGAFYYRFPHGESASDVSVLLRT
jgi:hypothetical protein